MVCDGTEFQYPLRVEVGCNSQLAYLAKYAGKRFSTLYGSKWVATTSRRSRDEPRPSFSTLYGSKWVATLNTAPDFEEEAGFQYPLRVEVGCNLNKRRHGFIGVVVSVPSTGRSGLQLNCVAPTVPRSTWFQYPLRVEVGCNKG